MTKTNPKPIIYDPKKRKLWILVASTSQIKKKARVINA